MENKNYDLRMPYNLASLEAAKIIGLRQTATIDKALYGVYCEALNAVREAISEGAQAGDLEKEIEKLGVF